MSCKCKKLKKKVDELERDFEEMSKQLLELHIAIFGEVEIEFKPDTTLQDLVDEHQNDPNRELREEILGQLAVESETSAPLAAEGGVGCDDTGPEVIVEEDDGVAIRSDN